MSKVTFTRFRYTKKSGLASDRFGVVITEPTHLVSLLEIPQFMGEDPEVMAMIAKEVECYRLARASLLEELIQKTGVQFKNFEASGISERKDIKYDTEV